MQTDGLRRVDAWDGYAQAFQLDVMWVWQGPELLVKNQFLLMRSETAQIHQPAARARVLSKSLADAAG